MSASKPNLALVGFMGVGKSTIGRLCSEKLGFDFIDTDDLIALNEGKSIALLFQEKGEIAFRKIESEAIQTLSTRSGLVISTGGGAILNDLNATSLRAHSYIAHLTAEPEAILRRIGDASSRPILASETEPLDKIVRLMNERQVRYRETSDLSVTTMISRNGISSDRIPEEIADEVIRYFRGEGKR